MGRPERQAIASTNPPDLKSCRSSDALRSGIDLGREGQQFLVLRHVCEEESGEFDVLVQDLMASGRTDVQDLAIREVESGRAMGPATS